jgi:hypothetical protein
MCEFVAPQARCMDSFDDLATEHNWLPFESVKIHVTVHSVVWKCIGKIVCEIGRINVGEFIEDVLYADIDDVRKTHDPTILRIKLNIAFVQQKLELLHHCGIILRIIKSKVSYLEGTNITSCEHDIRDSLIKHVLS